MNRHAHNVDWQQRAQEFSVGDSVYSFEDGSRDYLGRVVQVFPAIGMVDVEYANGTKRQPVEELVRYEGTDDATPPLTENVPGGAGTVSVPGGPSREAARRVAEAFVKKSLYWAARDRKYKASAVEQADGSYSCPKCKEHALRKAVYKRTEGASEKLLGCPSCMFLIKACDIVGHPSHQPQAEAVL